MSALTHKKKSDYSQLGIKVSDPKSGWCSSCQTKPPYEPNMTYKIRTNNFVLTYCQPCAMKLARMIIGHVGEHEF